MPVDESPTGFYIFFFLHIPAFRFFFFFYFLSFQELMKFLKNSFLLHERASPSYRRCHKWKNFLQKKNRKKKLFIRSSSIVQYKKKHAIHEILFIFNLNSKKKFYVIHIYGKSIVPLFNTSRFFCMPSSESPRTRSSAPTSSGPCQWRTSRV